MRLKGSARFRTASQPLSHPVRGLSLGPLAKRWYQLSGLRVQGTSAGWKPPSFLAGRALDAALTGHGFGLGVGLADGVCGSGASGRDADAARVGRVPGSPCAARVTGGRTEATSAARIAAGRTAAGQRADRARVVGNALLICPPGAANPPCISEMRTAGRVFFADALFGDRDNQPWRGKILSNKDGGAWRMVIALVQVQGPCRSAEF